MVGVSARTEEILRSWAYPRDDAKGRKARTPGDMIDFLVETFLPERKGNRIELPDPQRQIEHAVRQMTRW